VATLNFDLAQRDADRILEQDKEMDHMRKLAKLNAKQVTKEKKELWSRMNKQLVEMETEYNSYKSYAEMEFDVCHTVIDKQQKMLNKMFTELKQTKIMLEIPKLRQEVNKKNLKGVDFAGLTKVVGQTYKNVKKNLRDEEGILVESSDEETGRPSCFKSIDDKGPSMPDFDPK